MMDGMSVVGINGFDCEMASGSVPSGIMKSRQKESNKKRRYSCWSTNRKAKRPIY